MAHRRGGILALAIAVLALGALYALFRQDAAHGGASPPATGDATRAVEMPGPAPGTPPTAPAANVQANAAAPSDAPAAGVFRLVIADQKPDFETRALKAKQGDPITLSITSSRSGTLEVHGYNQRIAIVPGTEATLAFRAERAGRFPIDLHGRDGRHVEVTALEIMPR
jgi:hypothetical protein